ncbi:MAG: flagellar export chaperone FliS [Thermoguttaceae bacterium]
MHNTTESYLVTEVMTAAPQKLQLMLIDAAIRAAQQARRHWLANDDQQAAQCLTRAQQIVGEILASLNYEIKSDLVKNVAGVYLFLNRTLLDASLQRSIEKLDDALRVLNIERETWRQLCEKLASENSSQSPQNTATPHTAAPSCEPNIFDPTVASFSLEV